MKINFTRRRILQWLGAAAAYRAVAQEAPTGLTAGMSDASAVEHEVSTRDLSIGITGHGHILTLKSGPNKANVPFHACTVLDSCTQQGPVAQLALESGGVEFSRIYVHDNTRTQCTVVDRFTPAKSSIQWEVEIVGSGSPWSTAIETQLSWLNPTGLSFWTAWDSPPVTDDQIAQYARLDKLIDVLQRTGKFAELNAAEDEMTWDKDSWSDPLDASPVRGPGLAIRRLYGQTWLLFRSHLYRPEFIGRPWSEFGPISGDGAAGYEAQDIGPRGCCLVAHQPSNLFVLSHQNRHGHCSAPG